MAVLNRPSVRKLFKDKTKKSPATEITEDSSPPENSGEHQSVPSSCNFDDNTIPQSAPKINSNYKIKLHIDTVKFSQKPKDTSTKEAIKPRMQVSTPPVFVTIPELLKKLCEGYTISPGVMNGGAKAEHWTEQQLFCVDIDNKDDNKQFLQVDEAIKICEANNIPLAFYYYSFSHLVGTEKETARPKFRLCFILNEVITEQNKRLAVIKSLISLFRDWADTSCGNADRFFYGTNKVGKIIDLNAFATYENIISTFFPIEEKSQTENIHAETGYKPSYKEDDLDRLKRDFDLFGYMQSRNGEYKNISCGAMFKTCEICGHHDDLVYYKNTNTFYCFGTSGSVGGSIIDYLKSTENLSLSKAIDKFKYELCGIEREPNFKYTQSQKRDYAIKNQIKTDDNLQNLLQDIQPHIKYSYNDKGFGELFADVYENHCRYNITANQWYIYNGKVWTEDTGGMTVSRKAKQLTDALLVYSTTIQDEDKKTPFLNYVNKLGQLRYRKIMIEDSKDKYRIFREDFDKNSNMFNCQNGTLNLKTFEFMPHKSEDLLSKISNITYDATVKSPLFEKFIYEVMQGDEEKIEYLQKILGYALTSNTHLEACYILYGSTTRNGKSTLMETIAYMLSSIPKQL